MDYKQSVVRYYLYLLFTTGMRPGELLALTWNHVDFENQLLFTDNRVNSSTLEVVAPKTKDSIRYVPINHESIMVLKELKKEQRITRFITYIIPFTLETAIIPENLFPLFLKYI